MSNGIVEHWLHVTLLPGDFPPHFGYFSFNRISLKLAWLVAPPSETSYDGLQVHCFQHVSKHSPLIDGTSAQVGSL